MSIGHGRRRFALKGIKTWRLLWKKTTNSSTVCFLFYCLSNSDTHYSCYGRHIYHAKFETHLKSTVLVLIKETKIEYVLSANKEKSPKDTSHCVRQSCLWSKCSKFFLNLAEYKKYNILKRYEIYILVFLFIVHIHIILLLFLFFQSVYY